MMGTFLRPYRRHGWMQRQIGATESFYPHHANAPFAGTVAGTAAWAWTAYTQIVASTSSDFVPHALHTRIGAAVTPTPDLSARPFYEIEIAKGAAGSEIAIATLSGALFLS